MPLSAVYAYFKSYDKDSFSVFACMGHEPSEADVADFERSAGFRLPEEFREFTKSPLGGLFMEVREELWPRPNEYDVGPFWSFLYALKVFGIAEDIPDWLDVRVQRQSLAAEGSPLVPFLQVVNDGDRWCFDPEGRIVRWRDDGGGGRVDEVYEGTFSDRLMEEIAALTDRKDRKVRGEDRR